MKNFLQYLENEKRYSAHTLIGYETDIKQFQSFLKETFDHSDDTSVTSVMVRSWVVNLLEHGLSPRTVNRKLSSLKTYYRFLKKEGAAKVNPMVAVVAPKTAKRLPEFVPEGDMQSLLDPEIFEDDFNGCRDKLIIELLYMTGIRKAELISIVVSDVDLQQGLIKVTGKRNKQRIIPIGNRLSEAIRDYLDIRARVTTDEDNLLITEAGKKLYPKLVYRVVNLYLGKASSITKKSPHVLRHTFATHMLNNGADLNAIKELLGHANLSATQVYTHNSIEKLKNVYKQAHPRA